MDEKTSQTLQTAEQILAPFASDFKHPEADRLDAVVSAGQLKDAISVLLNTRTGYIAAITGLDHPAPVNAEGEKSGEDHLEALYHYCDGAAVITLRVSVPYSQAVIPSICDLDSAVTLYEREMMELFGIDFEGTPSRERLVLPDDWPDGVYPLRKSFTGFAAPQPEASAGGEKA